MGTKVTFAVEHKTADGKTHKPDTTVSVGDAEARDLILTGRARPAGDTKEGKI